MQSLHLHLDVTAIFIYCMLRHPVHAIIVDLRNTSRMTVVVQLNRHSVITVKRWDIIRGCRSGQASSVREMDLPEVQIQICMTH